jgi:hypothetical protein
VLLRRSPEEVLAADAEGPRQRHDVGPPGLANVALPPGDGIALHPDQFGELRLVSPFPSRNSRSRAPIQKGRAARALEGWGPTPWERAQFLALCQELADGWQPRSGIERQLLDTMAQAQTAMLGWLTRLSTWASAPPRRDQREGAGWEPPRLTEAEAAEQAAAMVERFHRLFVRSLRALRELRRHPLAVVVQGAGQVNIGERQVNVAPGGEKPRDA